MDDEKNYSVVRSIRISPEQQRKVAEAGINLSEFIRCKLLDELSEEYLINQKIEYHQTELIKWSQRMQRQQEKHRRLVDLSEPEIEFLVQSKALLQARPEFLEGRIKLYMNQFGKPFNISASEFHDLMNFAEDINAKIAINVN